MGASRKSGLMSGGVRKGALGLRRGRGFTLIEVMIVIAIILALSGLVGVALFQRFKEAKRGICETQMRQIQSALKDFQFVFERYPTDEEGLAVLWSKDALTADGDQTKWRKFMEDPAPNDAWKHPWGYKQVSSHGDEEKYDLWSNGPDGEEGTDDDIVSWTKEDQNAPGGGGGMNSTPPGKGGK